ncbi:MAG TPA: peptidyl-prolyl cis-trans isomerase [Candidatus Eisenbacteria bacterium]|nr:peptidyl-prolyl cis-trans isomerase [Candidatus Eisenbacteria bacterium]
MRDSASRAPRRDVRALWLLGLLLVVAAPLVFAQQPPAQPTSPFWGTSPPNNPNPFASPLPQPAQASPRQPASPVIARVEGREITEDEYDKIADPYFAQLKAQFGASFDRNMQRTASLNVLDELIKRELLAIESQRQSTPVTQEDIDNVIKDQPFFMTDGKFDPVKFSSYKSDPRSNYQLILPQIKQTAQMRKLDESLRQRFKPTQAQVRAEWAKRYDQVRFKLLPLLTREMPIEPEAPEAEWARYYQAHPDEFAKRTRVRLRYQRLPLPAEGDSTRADEEKKALARARGIADSLRRRTLADTTERFTDTGLFEIPAPIIPSLGRVQGLNDTLAKADTDSTIRVVGPYVASDAVFVGSIVERLPKQVPPMREVLGEVKRRADSEHRRLTAEADRRAYYLAHQDKWRGTRAAITRVTLRESAIATPKPPTPQEVQRWYAQHGHSLFGKPDTSKAWIPPLSDSLRVLVAARITQEQRAKAAHDALAKIVTALRGSRDPRPMAKSAGAAVESLTIYALTSSDTLWRSPFLDSLRNTALASKGVVQGPRLFNAWWAVWRIDAADTGFVPTYEAAKARSDIDFNQEKLKKDEAEARAYFDQHRSEFKTPLKYALDYVAVTIPPADSMKVTDAEVRRRYDATRETYREEEQVKARHILFSTREQGPDVDKKAKARADSLLGGIRKNGGDFAELAKLFSQEPGAANRGGDLGWFGRKRMVKEFEDAAFALKPGEMSPVVKTMFGYHIIKVEDRKAAGIKPFDEVKPGLKAQMAQARADSSAMRAASTLRRKLAAGGDVKALAAPYGGIIGAAPIAANENVPALGMVTGLSQDLPTMTTGKWAAKSYRANTRYAVFRLRQKLPAHPAEFTEAKSQALEAVRNQKRLKALDEKTRAIRTALASGVPLDSIAAPYGGLRDSGPTIRSASYVPMLGMEPRVVEKAFATKLGQTTDSLHVALGRAWLRVEERKSGDPATFTATSAQIEADLAKKRYDAWVDEKKKTVKIEVIRPDLKGPRAVASLN